MLSRLNASNPWALSIGLHFSVAALAALGFGLATWWARPALENVEFTLVESKKVEDAPYAIKPVTPLTPPAKQKARAVFGAHRKSHVSHEPDGVAVKPGNTLAKEADNEVLKEDDPDALPSPVEEFLVNEMPVVMSEMRIPYPDEAKKLGIQGAVVMDLLIDANGNVRDAKLLQGLGGGLTEAAMGAIKGFRFKPAKVQGKGVAVRIRYAYRFVLEN